MEDDGHHGRPWTPWKTMYYHGRPWSRGPWYSNIHGFSTVLSKLPVGKVLQNKSLQRCFLFSVTLSFHPKRTEDKAENLFTVPVAMLFYRLVKSIHNFLRETFCTAPFWTVFVDGLLEVFLLIHRSFMF